VIFPLGLECTSADWVAAEIHADGIIDRRDAASTSRVMISASSGRIRRKTASRRATAAAARRRRSGAAPAGAVAAAGPPGCAARSYVVALLRGGVRHRERVGRVAGTAARAPPPSVRDDIRLNSRAAAILAFRRRPGRIRSARCLGFAAMRLHVAVAIGVEDAELHRVHAHEMGELVHLVIQWAKSSR